MENIKIVVDSSSNLTELHGVPFASAPLKIITASAEYVDNAELDVAGMVDTLYHYSGRSSTSCPNINDWLEAFDDADKVICFTITSALSGSYTFATMAKKEYEKLHPARRVEVIDTLSAGPEIALMAEKCRDLIVMGKSFDEVISELREYKTDLLFVLESMKNLANNGRISKISAAAAGVLGVRAVGKASDAGTLELLSKCRGNSKTIETVLAHMKEFGYAGGLVCISHTLNERVATEIAAKISEEFPNAKIRITECRGLCSFYAEKGGLLLGFEA